MVESLYLHGMILSEIGQVLNLLLPLGFLCRLPRKYQWKFKSFTAEKPEQQG